MELPPEISEGDPWPGASWYKAVVDCLRSLRLKVARDSGLELIEGADGARLSIRFPPQQYLGITTTGITVRAGKVPGSGTVQPYSWDGTRLYALGTPIAVKNWTGSAVANNIWINYTLMYGVAWFNGSDCSGAAP